jgi:hypothetical protein
MGCLGISYRTLYASFTLSVVALFPATSFSATPEAIADAVHISGAITGGLLPTDSAEFTAMVAQVENGDPYSAAMIAAQTKYAANYLIRRLSRQMQNGNLLSSEAKDNDATAFLIAHFIGAGGAPLGISKIWSSNMTCRVRNAAGNLVRAADLRPSDFNTIDWSADLSCTPGQVAVQFSTRPNVNQFTIPLKHVGGYTTLSDRFGDNSFAENGFTDGTNLRFIANYWSVATGMSAIEFAATGGRPQNVPRFVPENDPNFIAGLGQTACIACHAGGLVSLNHGYSTVADMFEFDSFGFNFMDSTNTDTRKSLGSDGRKRADNLRCTSVSAVCNPDSVGADPNQSWDLAATWGARGLLTKMGWTGPTSGQGLNSLGVAIGKAGIVYSNLVNRVIREVCPLGSLSASDHSAIVAQATASDDLRQLIARVASNEACL